MAPRRNAKQTAVEPVEKAANAGDVSPPKRKKVQKALPDKSDDVQVKSVRITRNKQAEPKSTSSGDDVEVDKRTARGRTNAVATKKADTAKQSAKNVTTQSKNEAVDVINEETTTKTRGKAVTKKAGIANGAEPETKAKGKKKNATAGDAESSEILPPKRGKAKKNGAAAMPKKTAKGKAKATGKIPKEEEENGNVSEEAQETEMEKPVKVAKRKPRGQKNVQINEEQTKESANDEQSTDKTTAVPKKVRNIKKKTEIAPEKKTSKARSGKALAMNANVEEGHDGQEAKVEKAKGRAKKGSKEKVEMTALRKKQPAKKQSAIEEEATSNEEEVDNALASDQDTSDKDGLLNLSEVELENGVEEMSVDKLLKEESENEDSISHDRSSDSDAKDKTEETSQINKKVMEENENND